jgi:hypothetical protein
MEGGVVVAGAGTVVLMDMRPLQGKRKPGRW